VNPAIVRIGIWDTMELVSGVGNTTRAQLREMMRTFYEAPDVAKNDFIAALEPLFGRTRAEMIAVTEMTNAYSSATIETARHAPIDVMYEVSTVRDPDVCAICQEAEAGGPYPLDDTEHRPALHPRCRCDAVIVERPEEIPVERRQERVQMVGATKEQEKFWRDWADELPEWHFETLDRIEFIDHDRWLKYRPTRQYKKAAALASEIENTIWYRGAWGNDSNVVLHEIGHHALFSGERLVVRYSELDDFYAAGKKWLETHKWASLGSGNRHFVSRYAMINRGEFFAESYQAYIRMPISLQQTNPDIYKWLKEVIFDGKEFI